MWTLWTLLPQQLIYELRFSTLNSNRNSMSSVSLSNKSAHFKALSINTASTEMAGNIIPAIATTNAMTAGLCVLQSLKVFQNNLMQAKMVGTKQERPLLPKLTSHLSERSSWRDPVLVQSIQIR